MKVNSSLWHSYCSYLKCGFEEEEGWHFIIRIVEERSTVHLISSFHFQWRITGEIFLWNSRPGLILNTDKLKFVVHSKCPLTELNFYIEKSLCHKFVSLQCIKLGLKQVASWDYCMKDGKQFQNKFYWKRDHNIWLTCSSISFGSPVEPPPPKKIEWRGQSWTILKLVMLQDQRAWKFVYPSASMAICLHLMILLVDEEPLGVCTWAKVSS